MKLMLYQFDGKISRKHRRSKKIVIVKIIHEGFKYFTRLEIDYENYLVEPVSMFYFMEFIIKKVIGTGMDGTICRFESRGICKLGETVKMHEVVRALLL